MTICNMPINATRYPYIVAVRYDGALWYWGAFNDRDRANEAALEEGGIVLTADLVG